MDEDFKHGRRLQYDPKWKGPLNRRSCTDCICLIIFLAFMGGWGAVGWFAYTYGDARKLLTPIDSEGRLCGHDPDVENKPYLLFFDVTKCINITATISGCNTPQVCVKECPKTNYFRQFDDTTDVAKLRKTTICKTGINLEKMTLKQIDALIENNMCARWYLKSTQIFGRCSPITIPDSFLTSKFPITREYLEIGKNNTELLMQIEETLKQSWDDFYACRWTILAILGCGAVISLFYILIIRWFATPVIWLSIVGVCGLLGYGTYFFCIMYVENSTNFWLVLSIIFAVLLCIVLLVTIFLRNRIRLACRLIGEASKAVLSTTSTLAFPLIPWVLKLAVLTYALAVAAYVITMREQNYSIRIGTNCKCSKDLSYINGTVCSPMGFNSNCTMKDDSSLSCGGCFLNNTRSPWYLKYMHTYNLVGLLWLTFFMSAFGEMVLAGTFATWYWTIKKSDVPFFTLTTSIWRTLRYHVGTLAFGSFIITICRLIRLVLEYIDEKLKQYDNELVNFLMKCMKCYFWLLEKFLKFINKNAYIMCAIHGKGFCRSARSAFTLLMRNILRVFVLDKLTDWLLLMGKVLVTGGIAWGSWWYITKHHPEITYWQVPVIVIVVGTYLIASLFFSVYSMAVDTLFLCFLEDSERNDGTPEKPYYMSKGLRNILNK